MAAITLHQIRETADVISTMIQIVCVHYQIFFLSYLKKENLNNVKGTRTQCFERAKRRDSDAVNISDFLYLLRLLKVVFLTRLFCDRFLFIYLFFFV